MTMNVGLNTSPASTASALARGTLDPAQPAARSAAVAASESRSAFPEAALLSRRPLRYNVQLNQQLTAVQQADDYLAQAETRLLLLRQAASPAEKSRQSGGLAQHLEGRNRLSGGTVDRHLSATPQQHNSVSFALPGSEALLNNPGGETLLFALGGRDRQLAAVTLPEEGLPRQVLTRLNTGLGRLGIHARQTAAGELTFSVAEAGWERVSQHLSVRGEGHNYPADAFTLLAPRAEDAQADALAQQLRRGEAPGAAVTRGVLEHITAQRGQLRQQQSRVAARLEDMATALTPARARESAAALGQTLSRAAGQFQTLATALGAQANVHPATVKNLLG